MASNQQYDTVRCHICTEDIKIPVNFVLRNGNKREAYIAKEADLMSFWDHMITHGLKTHTLGACPKHKFKSSTDTNNYYLRFECLRCGEIEFQYKPYWREMWLGIRYV